jgi:hypothetical protein
MAVRSSSGIWKFKTSSFNCYVDHLHTMYSSGNIDVRNWVHLFESLCILWGVQIGNTADYAVSCNILLPPFP